MATAAAATVALFLGCRSLVHWWENRGEDAVSELSRYRIRPATQPDPTLQEALEALDLSLCEQLEIQEDARACGGLDLTNLRLAWLRPDVPFYGASVPKICILLGFLDACRDGLCELTPSAERELVLMIRRSDNELAAKYSQLVGLERVQALLESEPYRLYSRDGHGGLWCGKHYGIAEPRLVDPVGGHSHAATVRQCLRFYLMLEQERLVDEEACRIMRRIFAAPLVDFHNSNFVAGLNGRDLTVIRKSGLWEDWRLDTARVQHGDRTYLLCGMVRHAKGGEYLSSLARGVDEILCRDDAPKPYHHELHAEESPAIAGEPATRYAGMVCHARRVDFHSRLVPVDGSAGTREWVSDVVHGTQLFNEVLPSWNVDTPSGGGFSVELRVGRTYDDSWSPFLYVGDWGEAPQAGERTTEFPLGRIDVDYFRSNERFDRLQVRVRLFPADAAGPAARRPGIRRIAACLSDTTGIPVSVRPARDLERGAPPPVERWQRRLDVPCRSQRAEDREIASRICSPTSVAMVMAYRGVDLPVRELASQIYDPVHRIYGIWPRAVQAAFSHGVPGYLTRFADWDGVRRAIAVGQPLIVSIRAKEGQLTGAPYPRTRGHLLVVTGFDAEGRVLVNDPAAPSEASGRRAYDLGEMESVWLRNGGTAYVLLPR